MRDGTIEMPKRRRMAASVRREHILGAAEPLFFARGWDDMTIGDVLTAAGISKGAFPRHLAAKENLLDRIVEPFTRAALASAMTVRVATCGDALVGVNAVLAKPSRWNAELTPAPRDNARLGPVVCAEGWKDIAADAMVEDVKFDFAMLTRWARIANPAILMDVRALEAIMSWIDPILPMIDMRSFASSDVAAAEAFASDLPAAGERGSGKGLMLLSDGQDGVVVVCVIDGRIAAEDLDGVPAPLEAKRKGGDRIDLLVRFRIWDGFDSRSWRTARFRASGWARPPI